MVNIPMKTTEPFTKQSLSSINLNKIQGAKTSQTIASINQGITNQAQDMHNSHSSISSQHIIPPINNNMAAPAIPVSKPIPPLKNTIRKGQKVPLETTSKLSRIKACLGWNTLNASCDVDVSAFLLNASGKVIGDSWFVFYGQTDSPDNSTHFIVDQGTDREIITIDFNRLNPSVSKIVFVLTINEALSKSLNFSMLKDSYIRIIDSISNNELVSFMMDEYYANVTSMMIGELYLHNNTWKFNAIGNGVAKDLAGLCELYGVQVI